MIFANSYEEQLYLLLFKPLQKCFAAECVCWWKGLESAVLALKQAEECQGLTFHNIITRNIHSLWTWRIWVQGEQSEPIESFSCWLIETGWFNTKHQHYLGFEYSFKLYLLLFQIKCDPSPSILLKPTNQPFLRGDAICSSSNTDSTQIPKKSQKWAEQVEALGVDLHFSEFKSCFLGQSQLQEKFYIPTACWQVNFIPNKPILCQIFQKIYILSN